MAAFPPIVGKLPKVLILGSMPGRISLDERQYYAHPRNCFWWIMSELFNVKQSSDYQDRVAQLRRCGVAVWDVLHDCQRPGSLDSRIDRQSEQVNDFWQFLADYASLDVVGFNGRAAENIFLRHFDGLQAEYKNIRWVCLPSTSPAHASMTKQQKLRHWRTLISA